MTTEATYRGRLTDGRAVAVTTRGTTIDRVEEIADSPALPLLAPPLVDLQQNGALGISFHDLAEHGGEHLEAIARLLRRHGVGRCLITTATTDTRQIEASCHLMGKLLDQSADLSTLFPGVFHEGLFMSRVDGWRGAHPAEFLLDPDYDLLKRFDEALGGRIRLVNVAPEVPGGIDFIRRAVADGKEVTLGHACCDRDSIAAAVAEGAGWITHLGNGAAPQVHRFDNPFWPYLADERLRAMIICDGFHLPADFADVVFRCKGRANCLPVSDAAGFSGCQPGSYQDEHGRGFEITPAGHLHLANSELLYGAWFQLDRGVEFLVQRLGWSLEDAWAQCSTAPAAAMGIDLPAIAPGEEASFVLSRWHDGRLQLEQSVHLGQPYLTHPILTTDADDILVHPATA